MRTKKSIVSGALPVISYFCRSFSRKMPKFLYYIFILSICFGHACICNAETKDFIVVLDPGHGGKDFGAVGKITNEKTINLEVARRVKKMLGRHKNVKVVMTREDDTFLSLQERANIANKAHGDLFVSIHVNSVDRRSKNRLTVAGASVYTLGLHRTAENLAVAKRENAVMALEPDYSTTYCGFDPNSTESYIIFELNQNKHIDQSIQFARTVQNQLTTTARRKDRGVRQAGFWVLMATSMPAVLVELDFICNPDMEKFMHTDSGKDKFARSIYNAVTEYQGLNSPDHNSAITAENEVIAENETADNITSPALTYRIQIMACDKKLHPEARDFKGIGNVTHYTENGLYKYTVGNYSSETDAEKALPSIRKKFPQAFIIKWQNGERVK